MPRSGDGTRRVGDQAEHGADVGAGRQRQPDLVQAAQLPAAPLQAQVVRAQVPLHAVLLQEVVDGEGEVLGFPGLLDVAVEAGVIDGVDRRLEACLPREQDFHDAGVGAVDRLQEAVALHPRHHLVADHQLDLVARGEDLVDQLQRLLGRLRAFDAVRRAETADELRRELVEHGLLVVHADDVGPRVHALASAG